MCPKFFVTYLLHGLHHPLMFLLLPLSSSYILSMAGQYKKKRSLSHLINSTDNVVHFIYVIIYYNNYEHVSIISSMFDILSQWIPLFWKLANLYSIFPAKAQHDRNRNSYYKKTKFRHLLDSHSSKPCRVNKWWIH